MGVLVPQLIHYYAYQFATIGRDLRISATILFSGAPRNENGFHSNIAHIHVEQLAPAISMAGDTWELIANTPGKIALAWNEQTVTAMNLLVNANNGLGFFLLTPSAIITNSIQFLGNWTFIDHFAIRAPHGLPIDPNH